MLSLQDAARSPPVGGTGGRSRYSKALPSVPVADSQGVAGLPPLPLPKGQSEFQFPLPPRKSSRANDNNKGGKSIPRKPVGSSASKHAAPPSGAPNIINSPPLETPSPAGSMAMPREAVARVPEPPAQPVLIVPPESSPTDSLSSLLSAYSREPDAPMSGSTYTTASTVNTLHDSSLSPSLGKDGPSAGGHTYSQTQVSAKKSEQSPEHKALRRPAPPLKDDSSHPSSSSPKLLPVAPLSEKASAPRPEIWKRRPHTAEKNKELPDLKLSHSHGSTASTSTIQSIDTAVLLAYANTGSESKPTEEPKQDAITPLPALGLPGRNVKPVSDEKNQETERQMGSNGSKVQDMVGKAQNSCTPVDRKDLPARRDSKRPPTPEYRKGDASPPSSQADTIAKPASPVSATGSPKEGVLSTASKSPPPQPTAPSKSEPVAPSLVSVPPIASTSASSLPQAAPDLRLATNLLETKRSSPSPPREKPPPAKTQSLPMNDSNRVISASSDSALSRTSSDQNGVGPSGEELQRPATATGSFDPRIVTSDTHGPMYRGRDGTLYPEMKVVREPDPRAAYFPIQTDKPLQPGSIISSRPLNQTHYNCFQKHRTMNRRSNRNYPLTCQTCDKADTEDRWVCTFCHLRICETCLQGLNGHQKVLKRLVDQLRANTPVSLSSASPPGSALGIELPA
ncbi:hypothetical protein J3459_007419 [Metarhizium acridum]|nr:hypothetical protein J3459_007419 [Metarhizium acridum]